MTAYAYRAKPHNVGQYLSDPLTNKLQKAAFDARFILSTLSGMVSFRRWGLVVANFLRLEKRVDVVRHLVEGLSVRATSRTTEVSLPTVLSTLLLMGAGCDNLHNFYVHSLDMSEIECDEIWSYIAKKQARVTSEDPAEYGDAYTFLGMSRTKKLIVSYLVGKRDEVSTKSFVRDLRARLVTIPMISTDGFQPYQEAVGQSFSTGVDHAVIQKNYSRKGRSDGPRHDHRYEPPRDPFITKKVAHGIPNMDRASTSHIERANLTVRMHVRRFTRLCNGFSKKLENHRAAVSLHVAWYNFCRVHETLRITPAMEAGITDHVWTIEELVRKALTAPACAAPEPVKLVPAKPVEPVATETEKPATIRELPNGKGWLRVIDGGKAPKKDAPKAPTPPTSPASTLPTTLASSVTSHARSDGAFVCDMSQSSTMLADPLFDENGQGNLLAWKPKPRQLSLWSEE